MGNSFGRLFRITTFGESHGPGVGVVVDGCPSRLPLTDADIQQELDRRRPGQSHITTQRKEGDEVEILSGVIDGRTLGTPIGLLVRNTDARSRDYQEIQSAYRPSHADFTYDMKFGIRAVAGGGRASARETVGRVAAGAIARVALAHHGISTTAWVHSVADLVANVDASTVTREAVDANVVRCPDPQAAESMLALIEAVRKAGDSVGGIVRCVIRGVPAGLGEPVFDKLEATLAHAMMSIPAARGFEVGSGFRGTLLRGTAHNDLFVAGDDGRIRTATNRSGGIQGGISNGEQIEFAIAFKPTATVLQAQSTVTPDGTPTTLSPRGRHDPCVLPRAIPIVEAMANLVLLDNLLLQEAARALRPEV